MSPTLLFSGLCLLPWTSVYILYFQPYAPVLILCHRKYSHSDYKKVSNDILDDILPNLPIVRFMYVALFVTTLLCNALSWYSMEYPIFHFFFFVYSLAHVSHCKKLQATLVTFNDITIGSNRNNTICRAKLSKSC